MVASGFSDKKQSKKMLREEIPLHSNRHEEIPPRSKILSAESIKGRNSVYRRASTGW